jgi:hypothetical protein
MLGVSGQSKSISKRGEGMSDKGRAKTTTKLPPLASPPQKPQRLVKAPKQRQKAAARKEEPQPAAEIGLPRPLSILEVAKLRLSLPNESEGSVRVRFNHYEKSFPLHNSVLRWSDVDEEYCFSFVYRGDFKRYLLRIPNKQAMDNRVSGYTVHDDSCSYFIDLHDGDEYTLEVVEDPVAGVGTEGLRLHSQPLRSADLAANNVSQGGQGGQGGPSQSRAVDSITAQLRGMDPSKLNDAHAKDLIERRDLEDILYNA